MKSGTYQQSINVIYLLLWIHLCHLKMCQSLCCHFAFPAALNVWAGSAFLWLGFEVIVLLSHLSNYVTSRESKTGQCTIHNSLAMTQICIKWHRRSCNNCLICCSHLKTCSSAFVCRRSEETVHLQIVFLSSFLVNLLSSHLPENRAKQFTSPILYHLKCHQTVGVCASFSGCLTFHTDFLCLAATSAMRAHNVFSVFL